MSDVRWGYTSPGRPAQLKGTLNPELVNSTNPPADLVTSMLKLSPPPLLRKGQCRFSSPSIGQQNGFRQSPCQILQQQPELKLSSQGGSADSVCWYTSPRTETHPSPHSFGLPSPRYPWHHSLFTQHCTTRPLMEWWNIYTRHSKPPSWLDVPPRVGYHNNPEC